MKRKLLAGLCIMVAVSVVFLNNHDVKKNAEFSNPDPKGITIFYK